MDHFAASSGFFAKTTERTPFAGSSGALDAVDSLFNFFLNLAKEEQRVEWSESKKYKIKKSKSTRARRDVAG